EVYVVDRRPQREWGVFVQGVQDLALHLADGVAVIHSAVHLLILVLLDHLDSRLCLIQSGCTHHKLVVDLFAQQPGLEEGVAGVVGDGVHRPLLHLVLDGAEEKEQGAARIVSQVVVHAQGQPVGQHLLHHGLGPS
ncbi:unnamed protein product, partial [Ixodes persulcatus]